MRSILPKIGSLEKYDTLIGHNSNEGLVMLAFVFPKINISQGISTEDYRSALRDYMLLPLLTNTSDADAFMDQLIPAYNYSLPGWENKSLEQRNLKYAMDMIGRGISVISKVLYSAKVRILQL